MPRETRSGFWARNTDRRGERHCWAEAPATPPEPPVFVVPCVWMPEVPMLRVCVGVLMGRVFSTVIGCVLSRTLPAQSATFTVSV